MTSDDQPDAGELPDTSFFVTDGDRSVATDHARVRWNPEACHAGPPTGLLARAAEKLVPDKQLVRVTVELVRPVPMAGFRIRAAIEHEGRQVATTNTHLEDDNGQIRVRAKELHLAPNTNNHDFPTARVDTPLLVRFRPGGVNPDLTIAFHRPPEGSWLGGQAVSHWQPNGIGLADALLVDNRGPVGRALQTLLLRPMAL